MAAVIGRASQTMLGVGDTHGEVFYHDERRGCLHSPFAAYYIVTIALNSVCILAGIMSQLDFHQRYHNYHYNSNIDTWYMFNGVFGVLHILGCLYIVQQISRKPKSLPYGGGGADAYHHYQGGPMPPPSTRPQDAVVVSIGPKTNNAAIPEATPVGNGSMKAAGKSDYMQPQYQQQQQQHPYRNKKRSYIDTTEPLTFSRVRHVMCEDRVVAIYIVVFLFYVAWHFFLNSQYFGQNSRNYGMRFVMKCAELYIFTGPASFLFSLIVMKMKSR